MNILLVMFVVMAATLFALLEIQIEGENGWAEKLPTWRIKNPIRKILNWPYITGYHIYLNTFLMLLFQLPFLVGVKFNLPNELLVLETLVSMMIMEDFLWFVFNPKWGIKNFFSKEISWHSRKLLGFPLNYWTGLITLGLLDLVRRVCN